MPPCRHHPFLRSLVHLLTWSDQYAPCVQDIAFCSRKDGRVQGNSATTSHDPVSTAVSAPRESDLQVSTAGASNISQLSSQVAVRRITLAGPTAARAAVDTLLTTIRTIEIHHHHMGVVDGLRRRLSQLSQYLRNAPTARDGIEQYRRDEVTSEMQSTSDRLRKLDKRSIFVKQAIIGCSRKLEEYLDDYKFSVIEGREIQVQQFATSDTTHIPGVVTSGSLILIDATGHQREIPFEFGMSLEQLNKMLKLFFTGESKEARIQRQYMAQGEYDLCIDQGTQVTVLTSERDEWPTMEAGMNIVMRAIFKKTPLRGSPIQCDSCGCADFSMNSIHTNNGSTSWTVHCRECEQRHQLSISDRSWWLFFSTDIIPEDEIGHLIRNKHVQEIGIREEERFRTRRERLEEELYEREPEPRRARRRREEEEERRFFKRQREERKEFLETISKEAGHVLTPPWQRSFNITNLNVIPTG